MNPAHRYEIIYGTAWKEEKTTALVIQALECGYRAFDTANQRKHYYEEGVGLALAQWLGSSQSDGCSEKRSRSDLFIQTKFTYQRGQDHRLPYDPSSSFASQVKQSFESSLKHLGVDFLDALILHGPYEARGIHEIDLEVWHAMEKLVDQGGVRSIGVSNVSTSQLETLCEKVRIKPSHVQNRCYAATKWDQTTRHYCTKHGIAYQGFSLLTANSQEITHGAIASIAKKHSRSITDVVFRFCAQVGMVPLTGSSSRKHLQDDLQSAKSNSFTLNSSELEIIENISAQKF